MGGPLGYHRAGRGIRGGSIRDDCRGGAMSRRGRSVGVMLGGVLACWGGLATGQDRVKTLPGYARYDATRKAVGESIKSGAITGVWRDGGKAFEYRRDGKSYRFDVATRQVAELPKDLGADAFPRRPGGVPGRPERPQGVERGRQADSVLAPDKTLKATYRDRNLYLSDPNGVVEVAITTDGDAAKRTKNGKASWVYGEELYQATAFWWAPDSRKLAYYRFDESPVRDYYLQLDQTQIQDKLDVEAYPKAGTPNPIVELFVYDLKTKATTRVDVRDGQPWGDAVLGHYAYNVRWSPDGKELLFYRTNRHQNVLEFVAADPASGKCRVVLREEWPASWIENNPEYRWLKDGRRFLWATQKNGFKNFVVADLAGGTPAPLTKNDFDADRIVRVDEEAGVVDYLAHDGDNPMKLQLHRVKLDGSGDRRLTDPAFHHVISIPMGPDNFIDVAPDGKHFVDIVQTHDRAPATRVVAETGEVLATLAETDLSKYDQLGLKKPELVAFKAADGKTDLHMIVRKPSNYEADDRYPVLLSVYGGPETNGASETFEIPRLTPRGETLGLLADFGFLVVTLDARSAAGRGKVTLDSIYQKLGQTEIDDFAAAVRALRERPDVDGSRVGIFGTSYGGSSSLLSILRYPDLFQAACASSAVTDFRHYDTIYAERYLRTPAEDKAGYDGYSSMLKAGNLKGRLMIYYGTADDNVHPSNSLQLIKALNAAGKSYEVQVGPDLGHTAVPRDRMMEFFVDALVVGNTARGITDTSGRKLVRTAGGAAGTNYTTTFRAGQLVQV